MHRAEDDLSYSLCPVCVLCVSVVNLSFLTLN